MTKCKLCKTDIPEGVEYCQNCLEDSEAKSDELYLDSLLNSVVSVQNENSNTNKEMVNDDDNILKQEKLNVENEYVSDVSKQKEEEDYFDNTDDILALLQDYDDNTSNKEMQSINKESYNKDTDQDTSAEMNDSDDDLLALLDMISEHKETETKNDNDLSALINIKDKNLLAQDMMNNKELIDDDIFAINELLGEESIDLFEKSPNSTDERNKPNDIAEIYSDVLNAVNSLEDEDNQDLLGQIPDITNQSSAENKKMVKDKKKTFWQKIFKRDDSVEEENGEVTTQIDKQNTKKIKEKKKKDDKKVVKKQETKKKEPKKKEIKTKETKEKETNKKEKPKKVKVSKKKVKESKKKVIDSKNEDKLDVAATSSNKKTLAKTNKASAKIKKTASSKKTKTKAKVQILDEIDNIDGMTGKINKVAAAFVMIFFGIIVSIIIIGSNIYSYSLGIKTATINFERQRYTEAYNEVYGLNIKDEDLEIYDKIMTVMFVNKQLTSYNNNYALGKYPEALDSLLKGLTRYDKYIELATELGIKNDLDYVRGQIVGELENKFNMTEDEAVQLNNSEDQVQYSTNVMNAVLGKIN